MEYQEFEKNLGYVFRDKDLLDLAFTHTTYVFEHDMDHCFSNQRLEFIGDAVCDLIVGRKIYEMRPAESEGYLSKVRSISVCEKSFAKVARRLEIGRFLKLGKGEESTGGRDKDSTLADAFEAVIAAVYFDGGIDEAERVILSNLMDIIEDAVAGRLLLDYKSKLYELAQTKDNRHVIEFKIVDERGPDHMREFDVEAYADGKLLARASGHSKKDAEQNCAREALPVYESLFCNRS